MKQPEKSASELKVVGKKRAIHVLMMGMIVGFWVMLMGMPAIGEDAYLALREKMVREQIFKRGITDERILNAFRKVKRHIFVPATFSRAVYQDQMLNLGEDLSLQPPYTTAIMTSVIAPDFHKKVLEIGTGTGYHTAILAELVSEVYTIEIIEKQGLTSRKLLESLGYRNIKFKIGNGYLGWREYAPFDGIIVTCAPDHIPPPLIEQLAPGGRMVIPVEYASQVQEMILIEKDKKGKLKKTNLIPVQIVPMIRGVNDR